MSFSALQNSSIRSFVSSKYLLVVRRRQRIYFCNFLQGGSMKGIQSRLLLLFFIIFISRISTQSTCQQGRCVQCSPNQYSAGRASCTSCLNNIISNCSSTTGFATLCFPGNGLSTTFGTCTVCSAGTWSSGNSTCVSCITSNSAACSPTSGIVTNCLGGYGLVNLNGTASCIACTAGSFSPLGSSLPCVLSPAGQYSGPLASVSVSCSPDFFSSSPGSTSCSACAPGSISPSSATGCSNCTSGTYESGINSCTSCLTIGILSCGPVLNTANTCHAGYGLVQGACLACAGGFRSDEGNMLPCITCPAGQYSPALSSKCIPCVVDTFSSNPGSSACSSCSPGTISIAGSTNCTTCAPGSWESGIAVCTSCMGTGIATCGPITSAANTCNAGYGLVNGGCLACLPGTFAVQGGTLGCSTCSPGSFSLSTASSSTPCAINFYTPYAGSSACIACPMGSISGLGSLSCSPCARGNYENSNGTCSNCMVLGFSSCGPAYNLANTCSAGYGFNGWGACTACPGGTASPEGSTQPCISCLPGQFAYPISASCTPCFANTFAIGSGSTTCASCPSGQVSPIGASGCSTCFTGTYSTGPNTCSSCMSTGIASCGPVSSKANNCYAGFGLVNGGCQPCASGYASPANSATPCTICAAGFYSAAGSASCTPCPMNYVTPSAGMASCIACSAGKTSPVGGSICNLCAFGTYQDYTGVCSNCLISSGVASCGPVLNTANTCHIGYGLSNGICSPCDGGTVSPEGGSSVCSICPAGSFAPPISGSCQLCPLDFFSSTSSASACSACSQGTISGIGSTTCSQCALGQYESGINTCTFCTPNPGTESCGPATDTANSCNAGYGLLLGVCIGCTGGFFSPQSATTACSSCPPGSYAPALSARCKPCAADTFAKFAGTTDCTSCVQGTIAMPGSASCSSCPTNQYQNGVDSCANCMINVGIGSCGPATNTANTCRAGYGLVAGACQNCLGGFAAPDWGISPCYTCPPGQFSTPTSATCTVCPADTFSVNYGSPTCTPCAPGTISPPFSIGCSACAINTYHDSLNSCQSCMNAVGISTCGPVLNTANTCHAGYGLISGGICQMCIAGYFSQEGATAPCFICPVGYYSSQSAAACTICDSDTVAPYAGMSSCTACGTGQIAPVGSTGCGFCGTGTYKSSINTCTSCLNTGMATCNRIDGSGVSCNVGYGLTNGNCFPCLAGFASPQGTLTQCRICPPGSFSAKLAGSCISCTVDHYISTAGASVCLSCAPGSIAIAGAAICSPCLAGTFAQTGACVSCMNLGVYTCDPITGLPTACMTGFMYYNFFCNAIHARYINANFAVGTSTTINAGGEGSCITQCTALINLNGYAGATWIASTSQCYCRNTAASETLTQGILGSVVEFIGTCSHYNGIDVSFRAGFFTCQSVYYNGVRCLSSDGAPCLPVGCIDNYAASCNPASPTTTYTCVLYYILINGICLPHVMSRYLLYDIPGNDISTNDGNGNNPANPPTDGLCFQLCLTQATLNSAFHAMGWIPGVNCACKAPPWSRSMTPTTGAALLIGPCSFYAVQFQGVGCQSVTFNNGICVQVNGAPCDS